MKPWIWTVVLAVALIAVVGLEESRITKMQASIDGLEARLSAEEAAPAATGAERRMGGEGAIASRTERSTRAAERGDLPEEDVDNIGTSLRKMAENPAGRAMMNQGIKAMTAMWYADLIDEFDLTREEEDYFKNLLAGPMSEQQAIGMKMMNAKDTAEREGLMKEMETAKEDSKEAIKDFLNDDEDFAAYEAYEERLPERQQLDGLRAVMTAAEAPLTPEQENKVIEAMYTARQASAESIDWNGAGGMDAIASGDAAKRFEDDWERNSGAVASEVGKVLDGPQMEAFKGYQEQMKEMQMMGIKMAEKMFTKDGGSEGGE